MNHILNMYDPKSYSDACRKKELEKAMQHDLDSLQRNHTWDLVPRLTEKNIIKCGWVYETKFTSNGVVEHHKARLVTKASLRKKLSTTLGPLPLLQR